MNLIETLTFMAINDKNGKLLCPRTYLMYGVSGIALAWLLELGKIRVEGKKIIAVDTSSAKDEILNEVFGQLAKKGSPIKVNSAVTTIPYRIKRLGKRLFENLEDNGMIRIEQGRFLGLIPYDRYVITRVSEHSKLADELKSILLKGEKEPDPEKALLIAILHECGIMRKLFDREEREKVKDVLKKVGKGEFFRTLDDFIPEVQKAIKAAIAASQAAAT